MILTLTEVASQLRVSRDTIERLARELGGFKVGRIWRFDSRRVDAWIEARMEQPLSPATLESLQLHAVEMEKSDSWWQSAKKEVLR